MKKYINLLFSFIMMATLISVVSCDEDDGVADGSGTGNVSITSVTPDPQYQDQDVTLEGTGFDEVQFVFVGNKQAEFSLGEDTLTFTVPINATVDTNAIITLVMLDNYRVTTTMNVELRPTPAIQTFNPGVAVGGELTITGLSFNPEYNPVVTIDDVEATIISNTNTELVITVPNVSADEFLTIGISSVHGETESATVFVARDNQLANSDLYYGEGDEFTGWEKLNGGDRMSEVLGEEAYGGGRSIRVDPASGNPWDNQFASEGVPLNFGEEYTLIMWAKAIDEDAFMRFSISQWDGSGADYFYGEDKVFTNTWQPYTWTFTVTNDLPVHRAVMDMGATTGSFMMDHITLVPGNFGGTTGPPEILLNGSFEDGLANWETLNGTHEISTTEFYCGAQSMTSTGAGGNPWDVQMASDPMLLEVGTDYEISFWAKAAGPDGFFRISMSQWDGSGADYFYSPNLDITEDWEYFSFVTTAQTTASGDHRLLFDMGETTQTFFVDAVSVKEYVPPTSLYENGGFEDGLTGWETLNGTHDVSTTEFYSGAASLTSTGVGGNPWDVQMASDPVALTVGDDVKISFWAKAAGPDGFFRISMSQWDGNGADFFYSPNLDITEDWQYFSFVTTVGATDSGDHRLLFDMGETTQTFFVDDVSVVAYDACE